MTAPLRKGLRDGCLGRDLPMAERFRLAHLGRFEGLELTLTAEGPDSLQASDAEVAALARMAADGMPILSFNAGAPWQFSPSAADPSTRTQALDLCRRSLDLAARLGVDTLLYIPGVVTPAESFNYTWDAAQRATEALLPQAEQARVTLAVENVWNRLILSPRDMLEFVDQFRSPFVRVYFDAGNVLAFGYPEHWIEALGARIVRVHVKDYLVSVGGLHGFTQLLHGDVNWRGVMAALHRIGYRGWITPEVAPYPQPHEAWVHELSRAMDTILGLYPA
ncbi:MAG: sugar phosphate isomerase/epimerase [Actinobacteria bacterium]|nr:sugar phosphate isomerase/epimerase [Actinomycetota bacterium]